MLATPRKVRETVTARRNLKREEDRMWCDALEGILEEKKDMREKTKDFCINNGH